MTLAAERLRAGIELRGTGGLCLDRALVVPTLQQGAGLAFFAARP